MTDTNRNWGNQSQSNRDWEQNRNRSQDDENRFRENYGGYGNVGLRNEYNQGRGLRNDYSSSGDYNENRNRGSYGSNQGNDWSGTNYNQGNRGNDFWNSSDQWNRNQGNMGMYGNDQNRQDWQRRNMGSDYGDDYNRGYRSEYGQSRGYGGYGNQGGSWGQSSYGNRRYGNRDYGQRGYESGREHGDRDWWDKTRDEVSSWFGDEDAERRRRMDQMRTGDSGGSGYRGKGPKDYKRSEDRIREDVCDRLTDDDSLDASNIQIQVQGDEVILSGTVFSREQKRHAEDVVESISGVRNVENRLRVGGSDTDSTTTYKRSSDDTSKEWDKIR